MAGQIQAGSGVTPARPIEPKTGRLAYIDWMRGLACVLMFQTHCYNSWPRPEARKSALYAWSQLGGTLPAPLFVFLAGVSFAMVTQKWREKGADRNFVARTTILRGAEIFGFGLLFRVQEYVLGIPHSPWTDLLRVDVLNILGLSMMLMGVLCWATAVRTNDSPAQSIAKSRTRAIIWSVVAAAGVSLLTPLVWTKWAPSWLPWPLESYINGVHIYDKPQPWLFPLFPWSAFGFAGLAVGFFLFSDVVKRRQEMALAGLGALGALAGGASVLFDSSRVRVYPAAMYDYWHTSPNWFLLRCGILLLILSLVYVWCRWGLAQRGFSPLVQLGNTSLLVYWVHIEFVYGRFSILPKGQCGIPKATVGLVTIFLAMLALSMLRTRWKKRSVKVLARPVQAAAPVGS